MNYIENFISQLETKYEEYKEKALNHRRFKHRDILPLIEKLNTHKTFEISEIGKSTEGREIYMLKAGRGKTSVLLWSQMHGNEPTATQALFDIFNFFTTTDDFDEIKKNMLDKLTLYFIPMVNPDGAELYKRRNALDIDLNRDALRLEAIETKLLKKIRDNINAQYGFNLHDQEIYYTAGACSMPATISFLAPSFNSEQTIDQNRIASMEQIVLMNEMLQKRIPGQVGRYSDDFMPTAFGDNMQLWGTNVILIESGGFKNDPEKQYVRQLNFLCILTSFYALAYDYPANFELMEYFKIPENKKEKLFDLLIRNAIIKHGSLQFKVDIGIRREEIDTPDHKSYTYIGKIAEIGDMSYSFGYEEIDGSNLTISGNEIHDFALRIDKKADFVLKNSSGNVKFAISNGFIV